MKIGCAYWWVSGILLVVIALVVGGESAKQIKASGSSAGVIGSEAVDPSTARQGTGLQKVAEESADQSSMPAEIQQILKMAKAAVPAPVIQSTRLEFIRGRGANSGRTHLSAPARYLVGDHGGFDPAQQGIGGARESRTESGLE